MDYKWVVLGGRNERKSGEREICHENSPDDVANAVVFLAGAGFVTGTSLVVDGGRLLQSGAA